MGENGEFSEADFEACFKEFDKDGNGTISKDEMKIFIKKVAGLWGLWSHYLFPLIHLMKSISFFYIYVLVRGLL